jgi:hypothetical protein
MPVDARPRSFRHADDVAPVERDGVRLVPRASYEIAARLPVREVASLGCG